MIPLTISVNLWAVLASAIVSMIIGSVWYGALFQKRFMQASGMDTWTKEKQEAEKKKMGLSYFVQFLASLVMFYVLADMIARLNPPTAFRGIMTALIAWVGFVVPIKLGEAIWGGNKTLFWLGIGNMLVTLLAVGAILGAWHG